MTTFKDLGLNPAIQQALDELGYQDPTPIQEEAIPELLSGHDVIGQAQTGTGKTAAFGLPLLQYLDPADDEVQAVVLTPTRELCIQVTQALRSYAEHLDIEIVAVFGGAPIRSQQSQLRSGAHVVVATVGRMMDLMSRRSLVLTAARFVVLDEADEMLDLGFIEDVEKILRLCPSGRQTALFSATMPPPIQKLAEGYMYDPVTISITPKTLTVDAIQQAFVEVPSREKAARLVELLKVEEPEQAIIFTRTKIGASRLERTLKDKGLDVKALHGDMSQGSRDGVMIAFKDHRVKLLVATDIAARGLDIDHVTHVINFDVPNSSETYVHRIGRTGRVGRTGRAITFVTPDERDEIGRIERDVKTKIGEWETPEERLEHAPPPRRRGRTRDREQDKPAEIPESAPVAAHGEPDKAEVEKPAKAEVEKPAKAERPAKVAEPAAAPSGDAKADEDADKPPTTKLFVNRGERSGIEEEDLRWALREGAVLPEEAIHDVRVLHRFSFVEVDPDQAERTVEFLDGTKLKGKEIRLEVARS
ncbi:MAG TPA: DEAD/DEAH box helicase [Solirubrobacterales bacterium]|jgi:ATP-dependent RNA helicase DeaD|nr:DEAD/DEAH box helicase [Solirubrobacterales bacterium]